MNASQAFILIALIALAAIALATILNKGKGHKPFSKLAFLALILILVGMACGDGWPVGYGLMGIGVVLGVIDIAKKLNSS